MRRIWIIMMTVFTCLCITGCNQLEEDDKIYVVTESAYGADIECAVKYFENQHPDIEVIIEYLAVNEEEREAQIQKIRTETMALAGPDIFILNCYDELISQNDRSEKLFSNVNKAMESGVFAPLDEYMESDAYWGHGTYHKKILEAGTYKETQYVLPLGCNYYIYIYPEELKELQGENLVEWMEEADNSENEEMKTALLQMIYGAMPSRIMQPAIQYENQSFTYNGEVWASVILKNISEYQEFMKKTKDAEYLYSDDFQVVRIDLLNGQEEKDKKCQIVPSVTGNRVAAIAEYGAVSMSSGNKELSYEFLMLLLNEKLKDYPVNGYLNMGGAPVQEKAWDDYLSVRGISSEEWKESIKSSFDDIEEAYFPVETDCILYDEFKKTLHAGKYKEDEFETLVIEMADRIEEQYEVISKE